MARRKRQGNGATLLMTNEIMESFNSASIVGAFLLSETGPVPFTNKTHFYFNLQDFLQ